MEKLKRVRLCRQVLTSIKSRRVTIRKLERWWFWSSLSHLIHYFNPFETSHYWSLRIGVIEMKRIDILLLLIVLAFSRISVKNKVWAWLEMEIMLEKKKEAKSNKNSNQLLEVFLMAQSNQAIRYRTCPKPPSSTPICVNRDWVFHQRLFAMTASKSLFMLMMFRSTV